METPLAGTGSVPGGRLCYSAVSTQANPRRHHSRSAVSNSTLAEASRRDFTESSFTLSETCECIAVRRSLLARSRSRRAAFSSSHSSISQYAHERPHGTGGSGQGGTSVSRCCRPGTWPGAQGARYWSALAIIRLPGDLDLGLSQNLYDFVAPSHPYLELPAQRCELGSRQASTIPKTL